MKKFFTAVKTAATDFIEDGCMVQAAALAYYTIFSLPPLLVLVFFIAGWFGVSEDRINEVVKKQLGMPMAGSTQQESSGQEGDQQQASGAASSEAASNPENAQAASGESGQSQSDSGDSTGLGFGGIAQRTNEQTTSVDALGPASKIVGILILVFSATGVFGQLQQSLNRAWEVEPDPEQGGWKNFLVKRGLSLGMIAVIGFLLLVSLVLTTVVDELVQMVQGQTPGPFATGVGILLNNVLVLAVATLLFASLYKILPDAEMKWRDLWLGAFITALLFVIGKTLIGWYLQNSQVGSSWGSAAASMITLLVWVYYSSLIVLFGAELTQAWISRFGSGIQPADGAVRIVEEKRHVRE